MIQQNSNPLSELIQRDRPWKRSASRSSGGALSVENNEAFGFKAPQEDDQNAKRPKVEPEPVSTAGPKLINYESLEELQRRLLQTPAADQWRRIGIQHHHGLVVPLFSIRTENSGGVGEYTDLPRLVEWMKSVSSRLDVIQLLPLNALNSDNSPFAPRSCFSLNPLLLSLRDLPNSAASISTALFNALKDLNRANSVQWKEVARLKGDALQQYWKHQKSQELFASADCQKYISENADWLEGFSVFCVLKARYGQKPWDQWPVKLKSVSSTSTNENEQTFEQLRDSCDKTELNYHKFLQFLCHQQLSAARKAANDRRVFLKGDIPFLVSKDSADVWQNQNMFDCNVKVGAPPDVFSADGQDWGLPMYDWKHSSEKLLAWWKRRLQVASQYYDIYRIDHIVGFFRVWAIPLTAASAKEGSFVPATENEWITQGERLLREMLQSSAMLPIGEDLGDVPHVVRVCLQRLGICGTKVMRWEREWDRPSKPFLPISSYNLDSMTTVSTHDSETLELWWASQSDDVLEYCRYKGWNYGNTNGSDKNGDDKTEKSETAAPASSAASPSSLSAERRKCILRDSHRSPSLFHINPLGEYLALEPSLVHADAKLERVNVPGTMGDHNWAYRMRPTVEQLTSDTRLTNLLKEILR